MNRRQFLGTAAVGSALSLVAQNYSDWRAGAGYGNDSNKDHIVYGGTYRAESGGNGARLANIMISSGPEGARFALIHADSSVPKGHPETRLELK